MYPFTLERQLNESMEQMMIKDLERTLEDHTLICNLVERHETMLNKLEELVAVAYNMESHGRKVGHHGDYYDGYAMASAQLYEKIKALFNFAEEFKDY